MNSKNSMSLTEARKNIFKIAKDIQGKQKYIYLTEHGKAKAVIMSVDEFESWQETLEIMNDPELVKDIEKAEAEYKRGEYFTLEEVMLEHGFVLAEKAKKKYGVQNSVNKKSKKTVKKD